MKSRWVDVKGKRILYVDLSNFGDDTIGLEKELAETIPNIGREMYEYQPHSVLVLVDLRNTAMTQASNRLLTERIEDTKKYIFRTAVVGLTGLRKVFLNYFAMLASSETGSFDEPDAAIEWLLKQAG